MDKNCWKLLYLIFLFLISSSLNVEKDIEDFKF